MTLGDRIAQIRRRRSMTQEELADRAGISADVVKKLEQNRRTSVSMRTLHALARGLEVETAALLSNGVELDPDDDGDAPQLLGLRRILTPSLARGGDDQPVPGNEALRAQTLTATRAYRGSSYKVALGHVAALLGGAELAASERDGDPATHRILACAYITAARTLVQLRCEDLGYEAVRRSLAHAERAGDAVLYATCGDSLNWILIRQARFAEAEETATILASSVEPRISSTDRTRLGVWGRLHVQAASAAARNNRPGRAADYLSLARTAATRVGGGQASLEPYRSMFSPVAVHAIEVEVAMVAGDPERALRVAASIPAGGKWGWGATWERHLLTVAEAQVATRRYDEAAQTVVGVHATSPEWLKNQRLARYVVRDLLDSKGVRWARNSGLADLAAQMKIAV